MARTAPLHDIIFVSAASCFFTGTQKQSMWTNKVVDVNAETEMREIWDDNCDICPADCQENGHINMN